MPLGSQPRRARGTVEHPDSALRLRQVLAGFGLVVCLAGGGLLWWLGLRAFALVTFVIAITAIIDLMVVTVRIRRR